MNLDGKVLEGALRRAGFRGEVPPTFLRAVSDVQALKWIAHNFDVFSQPLDNSTSPNTGDLRELPDQNAEEAVTAASLEQQAWLGMATDEDILAQLKTLEEEEVMLQQQLQELQTSGRQLEFGLQSSRGLTQQLDAAYSHSSKVFSVEQAGATQLNAQLNKLLEGVQHTLKELTQLVMHHAPRWLMAANDLESYFEQNKPWTKVCNRFQEQSRSRGQSKDVAAAAGQQEICNPFEKSGPSRLLSGVSTDEHDLIFKELSRLRFAFHLGESQYLDGTRVVAGLEAEYEELQQLWQETQQGAHCPKWSDTELARRLKEEEFRLEQELERLDKVDLRAALAAVIGAQDAAVVQKDYDLKQQRQQMWYELKSEFLKILVEHGYQQSVLDTLRKGEINQMHALLHMIHALAQLLVDVCTASAWRSASYTTSSNSTSSSAGAGSSPARHNFRELLDLTQDPHVAALHSMLSMGTAPSPSFDQHCSVDSAGSFVMTSPMVMFRSSAVGTPGHTSLKELTEGVEKLQQGLAKARREADELLEQDLAKQVQQGRGAVQEVHGLLFESGQAAHPTMTHPKLAEGMAQLHGMCEQLTASVNNIITQYQEQERLLQSQGTKAQLERSVLKLFWQEPERLQAAVQQLQGRLEALQANSGAMHM